MQSPVIPGFAVLTIQLTVLAHSMFLFPSYHFQNNHDSTFTMCC